MAGEFKDAPVSMAEARAEKAGSARLWSPRDALISMLRDIDHGKANPKALVIVHADETAGKIKVQGCYAGDFSTLEFHGLLAYELHRDLSGE